VSELPHLKHIELFVVSFERRSDEAKIDSRVDKSHGCTFWTYGRQVNESDSLGGNE
jgi:hypothetical protein